MLLTFAEIQKGIFTIPGEGVVDYHAIFKLLADNDYKGWVVVEAEQDPAKANPLEYAIRARQFIADHTGL
ncbi:MAG: TIM barrel protein [Spirochaetes bacterium]|nr:TIM barrel protein [Spirochaetota bacterium]